MRLVKLKVQYLTQYLTEYLTQLVSVDENLLTE